MAVAHVTQCPYCIRAHTELALKKGASEQEIMEAIWVAAEMRAGGALGGRCVETDPGIAYLDGHRVLVVALRHDGERTRPIVDGQRRVASRRAD